MRVRPRRLLLGLSTLLAAAAPMVAVGLRWNDARHADRALSDALAILDAPVARAATAESLDWRRAEASLQRARSLDVSPEITRRASALWHVARAFEDLSRGDLALANQEAQTASREAPEDPHTLYAVAAVSVRRNEPARAEHTLEQLDARRDVPDALRVRATLQRIDLMLDGGRAHQALTLAEALSRSEPNLGMAANRLGIARMSVGDSEGARQSFERARTLGPTDPSPWINLARLARDRGDHDEARSLLEHALGLRQDDAEAWLAYGIVLSDAGPAQFHAARAAIHRAAQLAPDDGASWVAQGDLDLREQHWNDAADSFREALRRTPDHVGARTNLGVTLAHLGDRRGAMEAFLEATRRSPQTGEAWNGLGAMRLALEDAAGAVGPLQQATVLLPDDPNPAMNLGLALERLQRWNDAARAFHETLRRAPDHEMAQAHLAALQPSRPVRHAVRDTPRG